MKCKSSDVTELTKEQIPKFYIEVLKSWFSLKEKNTDSSTQNVHTLEDQIIWYNSNVKFRNKLLMFKKWKDAGIMFLSDIVVNNRFVNLIELGQLVRCPNYLFDFQKILTAIPRHWKTLISNNYRFQNSKEQLSFLQSG